MRPLRPADSDPEWVDQRLRDLELQVQELVAAQGQIAASIAKPPTRISSTCHACCCGGEGQCRAVGLAPTWCSWFGRLDMPRWADDKSDRAVLRRARTRAHLADRFLEIPP